GSPDVVMLRRKIAIFVHGCFWHQHPKCKYARLPSHNADFWRQKLDQNVLRDKRAIADLVVAGWRVLVVWECATRTRPAISLLRTLMNQWINSDAKTGEIALNQDLNIHLSTDSSAL